MGSRRGHQERSRGGHEGTSALPEDPVAGGAVHGFHRKSCHVKGSRRLQFHGPGRRGTVLGTDTQPAQSERNRLGSRSEEWLASVLQLRCGRVRSRRRGTKTRRGRHFEKPSAPRLDGCRGPKDAGNYFCQPTTTPGAEPGVFARTRLVIEPLTSTCHPCRRRHPRHLFPPSWGGRRRGRRWSTGAWRRWWHWSMRCGSPWWDR